jgi:vanillate O-demethylase monooxygenase subunit
MKASHNFVLNAWYAIGWETSVGRSLNAMQVCGISIVAYRRFDRSVVVVEDSCAHRALPLSLGKLVGDEVECAYHGLRFKADGACTFIPGQDVVPAAVCIRSFPVAEKHRLIWVWLGDPALADPAAIPDLHWTMDAAWSCEGNSIEIACDYKLLLDNLMDLTHETFVHSSSIGHSALLDAPFDVSHSDASVTLSRWISGAHAPPFLDMQLRLAQGLTETGPVDRWQIIEFESPSTVVIDVGVAPVGSGATAGDRSKGVSGRVINVITPKDDKSCHYHFAFVRNFLPDSCELDQEFKQAVTRIFREDKVILEAQQIALDANPDKQLRNLKIDSGSVWVRRAIDRQLKAEQQA